LKFPRRSPASLHPRTCKKYAAAWASCIFGQARTASSLGRGSAKLGAVFNCTRRSRRRQCANPNESIGGDSELTGPIGSTLDHFNDATIVLVRIVPGQTKENDAALGRKPTSERKNPKVLVLRDDDAQLPLGTIEN
jgi:hypothetical protein